MQIDIAKQIGAVTMKVSSREHEGKPARVVVASQIYATTAEDVFEAITSAERIPRWFMPITGDLRVGGRFQLVGNAAGEILICEPPTHLKVTWEFGGEPSWVEVWIEAVSPKSARLTLEHVAHVSDERWEQFGPGAVGAGWDLALVGLTLHVETRAPKITEEGMAWMTSGEGKAFVRQSSEAWCRASIADGTDPAVAKAAADRTTKAYSGA
jgi:uncharacterized protein YndB with AHSA1/START domain